MEGARKSATSRARPRRREDAGAATQDHYPEAPEPREGSAPAGCPDGAAPSPSS